MSGIRACTAFIARACAAALALSGCGSAAQDTEAPVAVDRDASVDRQAYAGDVTFRIDEMFAARERDVPYSLYLGLSPEADARLSANAFVDLRELQLALPELLSEATDPNCSLGLDVTFRGAEAEGDAVRGRAGVKASVYRCPDRGTEEERRGWRLLTQTIDVAGTAGAGIDGDCFAFHLLDLDLAPRNLLGRLATLLGVTERVRVAILEEARSTLSENPVCADLPEALAALDPQFTGFGLREIGEGGIGAALSGSVELSAESIVALLAAAADRAQGPDASVSLVAAEVGRLDLRIDAAFEAQGREIPYGLDIRLSTVAPTRIGVETQLDLRAFQQMLPDLLVGQALVDTCGGHVSLRNLEAEARDASVIARGQLEVETFDCERTGPGSWQRGALLNTEDVGVRADMSAEAVEGCVVFRLLDLARDPPGVLGSLETGSGRSAAARALVLEAVGLVLEENPVCPGVPPELAVLDPSFDRGVPEEIGDGGIGIAVDGTIDVSPKAIVDLLRLLQARGAVPPPP